MIARPSKILARKSSLNACHRRLSFHDWRVRFAECITTPIPRNNKVSNGCVHFVEMWFCLWRKEENPETFSAGELRSAKICGFQVRRLWNSLRGFPHHLQKHTSFRPQCSASRMNDIQTPPQWFGIEKLHCCQLVCSQFSPYRQLWKKGKSQPSFYHSLCSFDRVDF